jgi:hypothetical protein
MNPTIEQHQLRWLTVTLHGPRGTSEAWLVIAGQVSPRRIRRALAARRSRDA